MPPQGNVRRRNLRSNLAMEQWFSFRVIAVGDST
jgi:hypothetical protein